MPTIATRKRRDSPVKTDGRQRADRPHRKAFVACPYGPKPLLMVEPDGHARRMRFNSTTAARGGFANCSPISKRHYRVSTRSGAYQHQLKLGVGFMVDVQPFARYDYRCGTDSAQLIPLLKDATVCSNREVRAGVRHQGGLIAGWWAYQDSNLEPRGEARRLRDAK